MVSDTPSQPPKDEKREDNLQAPGETAKPDTPAVVPDSVAKPAENGAAVDSAMADVAAAIRRHEAHPEDASAAIEADGNQADDNQTGDRPPEGETEDRKSAAEDGKSSATPPPVMPPPARKSPGFIALLAAGVAGGVIALAGAYLVETRLQGKSATADIANDFARLQQQVEGLASAGPDQNIEKNTSAISAVQSQLAALEQKFQGLSELAAQSASVGSNAQSSDQLQQIESQLGELQKALKTDETALQGLTQTTAGLQSALSGVQNDLSAKTEDLQQKLSAFEQKVDQPGKELMVARAIAAAGLKSAIDRGRDFAGELATYQKVAPSGTDLGPVAAFADKGIPTREQLANQFSSLAGDIIKASDQPGPDEGVMQRLFDSAKGLVSVRPIGDVEGDSVPAIVARIENDLNEGQLQAAASEWAALPDAGKQVSASFEAALQARIDIDQLVSETLNQAIGSMAGNPSPAN